MFAGQSKAYNSSLKKVLFQLNAVTHTTVGRQRQITFYHLPKEVKVIHLSY